MTPTVGSSTRHVLSSIESEHDHTAQWPGWTPGLQDGGRHQQRDDSLIQLPPPQQHYPRAPLQSLQSHTKPLPTLAAPYPHDAAFDVVRQGLPSPALSGYEQTGSATPSPPRPRPSQRPAGRDHVLVAPSSIPYASAVTDSPQPQPPGYQQRGEASSSGQRRHRPGFPSHQPLIPTTAQVRQAEAEGRHSKFRRSATASGKNRAGVGFFYCNYY